VLDLYGQLLSWSRSVNIIYMYMYNSFDRINKISSNFYCMSNILLVSVENSLYDFLLISKRQ